MAENPNNNDNTTTGTSNVASATQTIFAKPFPDVSKIEVFTDHNFRRWQEHVSTLLDMYGVAHALTTAKPDSTTAATGSMRIRYAVTLYSVCYLTIYSMFMLLIRMRKIFGILLSSNILPKTSSDKGS